MQQLGESVVSVLKKNGVSREHPLFKQYYTKLFNVSKHFLNVRHLLNFPQNLSIHASPMKECFFLQSIAAQALGCPNAAIRHVDQL